MATKLLSSGAFPAVRMRRKRKYAWSRALVRETVVMPEDLVLPLFVQEGEKKRTPISLLPGVERLSIDLVIEQAKKAVALGIPAIALFPVIDGALKTEHAREASNPQNLVCRTIKAIKQAVPDIGVICDVALDPYTSHGHDGLVKKGEVLNDETVEMLCRQAEVLADAGCDIVAPSDMMDGKVAAIRQYLDKEGHSAVLILSYAAKFASAFYGPFREAVGSANALGKSDKRTYQMDPANGLEALQEVALDIQEGADMVMVKPGLPYLDVIRQVKEHFAIPVFAYQVSGEYAMLKMAAREGCFDAMAALHESLLAMKRAGASAIFTYGALEMAEELKGRI